jgi:hypothetical protein
VVYRRKSGPAVKIRNPKPEIRKEIRVNEARTFRAVTWHNSAQVPKRLVRIREHPSVCSVISCSEQSIGKTKPSSGANSAFLRLGGGDVWSPSSGANSDLLRYLMGLRAPVFFRTSDFGFRVSFSPRT